VTLLHNALVVTGIVVLAYFAVLNLILLIFTAIAWRQVTHHARAKVYGGAEEAFSSPLTPAISVLMPAFNEQAGIIESVRSLVRLRYSQHEVIVINDGSTDETLSKLQREFDLVPVRKVLRDSIPVRPIRTIYISRRHPELTVIDKENGGKADALNTGLNAARHPYICSVDADALLDEDALLYVAKPILDDPERTVATGGIVRIANGCRVEDGMVKEVGLPKSRLATLQVVEYFRAFLIGRVGWSEIDSLLIISGAFGLFRRSFLEAVGGYWTETVGEDVELVVRLHGYLRKRGEDYRIAFVPHPVCWTEVPEDWGTLIRQRRRWQRGLGEALWRHRGMIGRPRYGMLGLVAIPYFLVFELFGPVIELFGYLALPLAVATGRLSTSFLWAGLILAILFGLLLSIAAVALEEFSFRRHRSSREVSRTLAYAVLENFGFRQVMGVARLIGLVDLVRRRQRWGLMRRRGFGRVQLANEATSLTDARVPPRPAPDRRSTGPGDSGTSGPPLLSRRFRVVLRLAVAAELAGVAVSMLHATTGLGSTGRDAAFTGWIYPALYLLPAAFCIARAWVGRGERLAWLALGAGLVVAGTRWLHQGLVVHELDSAAHTPINAALGAGFYLVTAVGLILLLRLRAPDHRKILWLDGLGAALTVAALAAFIVIEPIAADGTGTLSMLATYPVVPIGDLVLLVLVAIGMASLGWRPDRAWALVGAAFMIWVAADSVYLHLAAEGTSSRGTLLKSGWLAAACVLGYAAWRDPGTARAKRGESTIALVAPLLFAGAALMVLAYGSFHRVHGRENAAAVLLASAALLVPLVRSGLSLAEQCRLRAAASADPLTGLMNYSGFHSLIESEIERAQRSGGKFCVLTYKLDGLKRLNELRGHREGDRQLRRLAEAIRSSVRATDTPARIAGAEFAVVFPATSRVGAQAAAERLKRLVAVLDEPVAVTVGVAEWPMDGPGKERLLRRADVGLPESNLRQPAGTAGATLV
jgi:diguanylate cyclase (GGDEF)-like protein